MIDAENSGAVSYVLLEILRFALRCMDCVTQSALPLGHNLKNDLRKSFCVSITFDFSQTSQRVILRATPEESLAEPVGIIKRSVPRFFASLRMTPERSMCE